MSELIDEDYVLISPSARNPRILKDKNNGRKTSGFGWHVDSRVVKKNNSLIKPSLNFFAIIALEDFTTQNASTKYCTKCDLCAKIMISSKFDRTNHGFKFDMYFLIPTYHFVPSTDRLLVLCDSMR
mgnify:CR=1 FL=1